MSSSRCFDSNSSVTYALGNWLTIARNHCDMHACTMKVKPLEDIKWHKLEWYLVYAWVTQKREREGGRERERGKESEREREGGRERQTSFNFCAIISACFLSSSSLHIIIINYTAHVLIYAINTQCYKTTHSIHNRIKQTTSLNQTQHLLKWGQTNFDGILTHDVHVFCTRMDTYVHTGHTCVSWSVCAGSRSTWRAIALVSVCTCSLACLDIV